MRGATPPRPQYAFMASCSVKRKAQGQLTFAFLGILLLSSRSSFLRGGIRKFPDWVDKEIYAYNNKHSRSNTKSYGGKTHYTDSQNSDTTAPSGRELYRLQFSCQAASPETFGYATVFVSTVPRMLGTFWEILTRFVSRICITSVEDRTVYRCSRT
jgi:hypothetical protein